MKTTAQRQLVWVRLFLIAPVLGAGLIGCSQLERKTVTNEPIEYHGWQAFRLANEWIHLTVAPGIGGRVIQFELGEHPFFWVNPELAGQRPPPSGLGPDGAWLNYGGDKLWPAPQGWSGEHEWPGPPDAVLDGQPYQIERGANDGWIRVTSGDDPRSGIRFSRKIRVLPHGTGVHVEATMTNVGDKPRRWGIWAHTQLDAGARDGTGYNPLMKAYTPYNPESHFQHGYDVIFGEPDNPSFAKDTERRLITVKYLYKVGKIGVDSPGGWVATVDGATGDVFVQRFVYEPDKEYPEGSSVEFWHNGLGRIHAFNQDIEMPDNRSENPYIFESEILSPFAALEPGESYTWKYEWWAANVGGDFVILDVRDGGVTAAPFEAEPEGNALRLRGRFGVFFPGVIEAVFQAANGEELGRARLMQSTTPLRAVVLDQPVQAPAETAVVALQVVDRDTRQAHPLAAVAFSASSQSKEALSTTRQCVVAK
jgi:hypothetical protein